MEIGETPTTQAAPIFIVGCPRSGTTLLRNLLRSHPRLTFAPESHFIPSFYRLYGDPQNEASAVSLARRVLRLEWVRPWQLPLTPSDFKPDRSFAAVLERLYGAWAVREGKARWGDKTPHYVVSIPTLLRIFPAAKIIHVVRDGRDVALSWLIAGFEPRNLFMAASLWTQYVGAGRAAAGALSHDRLLEVRFEALVANPNEVLRPVCEFMGEAFTPDLLNVNCIASSLVGRRWKSMPYLQKSEIVGDNVGAWKNSMSVGDRSLFESVAGELLGTLGYEVEGLSRPLSRFERSYWTLHHRFWWTIKRLPSFGSHRWFMTEIQLHRARWLAGR